MTAKEVLRKIQAKSEEFSQAQSIESKLDIAYEVYELAGSVAGDLSNISDTDIADISSMGEKARYFMQMVFNVESDEEMEKLAQKRKEMRQIDPSFLARGTDVVGVGNKGKNQYRWNRLAKLGQALNNGKIMRVNDYSRNQDAGAGKNKKKTTFLNHEERAQHRCILKEGVFYQPLPNKNLDDQMQFKLYDTSNMISHDKNGYAAYVINAQGEISIFNHHGMTDGYAHSSMNAGASVFGAGELKIENGILKELTNYSGHYQPNLEKIYNTLKYLKEQGTNIDATMIRFYGIYNLPKSITAKTPFSEPIKGSKKTRDGYYINASDVIKWGDNLQLEAKKRQSDLIREANNGNTKKVKAMLLEEKPFISAQSSFSALMLATAKGKLEVVTKLLAAKGATTKKEITEALVWAAASNDLAIFQKLHQAANPDKTTENYTENPYKNAAHWYREMRNTIRKQTIQSWLDISNEGRLSIRPSEFKGKNGLDALVASLSEDLKEEKHPQKKLLNIYEKIEEIKKKYGSSKKLEDHLGKYAASFYMLEKSVTKLNNFYKMESLAQQKKLKNIQEIQTPKQQTTSTYKPVPLLPTLPPKPNLIQPPTIGPNPRPSPQTPKHPAWITAATFISKDDNEQKNPMLS